MSDTFGKKDTSAAAEQAGDTAENSAAETPPVTSAAGDNHDVSGVKAGGLEYTTNGDGTRNYPDQGKVDVTVESTPQPEVGS